MVEKSLLRTDLELENFFSTIREDILIIAQEHSVMEYDHTNYIHLNAEFRPLIENKRQLSSVLMANSDGDEFLLLDLDTAWMIRVTNKGSKDSMSEQLFWYDEAVMNLITEIERMFRMTHEQGLGIKMQWTILKCMLIGPIRILSLQPKIQE